MRAINTQPTLFETEDKQQPEQQPTRDSPQNWDALENWAFCYTATSTGNNSGIKYLMSLQDAMTWCSSNLSKGVGQGAQWAFFFTTVATYLRNRLGDSSAYNKTPKYELDTRKLNDDGRYDNTLADMGITKIPIKQWGEILTPLGVTIL